MRKQFDIELGGSKMTAEIAKHLMLDVMLGGIKHRANTKTIVYGVGTYSNVVADMKAFKKWCKSQGLKVTSMYRNRQIETLDKEFTASVITYTF